jgi:uncharacterized protein (DUF1697 family)
LLRSVNVAGHGRIAMDELRASFDALGHANVTTYIQTGNVFFTTASKSQAGIVSAIEERLDEDFGGSPAVLLRSVADVRRIGSSSPFAKSGADPARHHVTFLATTPTKAALEGFSPPPSGRDELVIDGKEVYVHTPDGYAGTKYTGTFLERRLGVVSTTRNWNTVSKLSELSTR